ncbi:RsiV family protein [Paeniglutamicibacter cryotolerans]|uniref:Uncharacterized protein n=1 Tax=Paeniglutamicibacter cryotolerans TaxID=670079 RepID=A0A839QNJ7_9MICC|nr:RsiV family protein [Paeniglutamicibacter cryotolerans]MBB2997173.1 hypothetical protein [Paeniglutamicibacter cryotolerans]
MSTIRSFTQDLKTGKKVSLGTFIAQGDRTTKVAVATNFALDKKACTWELDPFTKIKSTHGYIPNAIAWNVSSKGIRLHYAKYSIAAGFCGPPSVLLPWGEVATTKAMSGKVKKRIYAYGIKWNKRGEFYEGGAMYVATQGRKMTMFFGPVGFGDGSCVYGVRSGKTATLSAGMSYYNQKISKIRFKLLDTSSNPKISPASLTKGWKPASAKDLATIKKAQGKIPSARSFCRG